MTQQAGTKAPFAYLQTSRSRLVYNLQSIRCFQAAFPWRVKGFCVKHNTEIREKASPKSKVTSREILYGAFHGGP